MSLRRFYQRMKNIVHKGGLDLINNVLEEKRPLMTSDEFGGNRPIIISVILPTFLRTVEELTDYRYEVVRNELISLGQLLSKGLVDEVVTIDGSRGEGGIADEARAKAILHVVEE